MLTLFVRGLPPIMLLWTKAAKVGADAVNSRPSNHE